MDLSQITIEEVEALLGCGPEMKAATRRPPLHVLNRPKKDIPKRYYDWNAATFSLCNQYCREQTTHALRMTS